jgi:hypothetical protein
VRSEIFALIPFGLRDEIPVPGEISRRHDFLEFAALKLFQYFPMFTRYCELSDHPFRFEGDDDQSPVCKNTRVYAFTISTSQKSERL